MNFKIKSLKILWGLRLISDKKLSKISSLINNIRGIGIAAFLNTKESGEARILKIIQRQYPAMIVFDVGANIGDFVEIIINNLYHKLYVFEPLRANFKTLQEKFGDDESIILNNVGCSDKSEEIVLWSNWEGAGASTFFLKGLEIISKKKQDLYSEKINTITIDDYLANNSSVNGIDFLKIDVEGFEMNVLKGAFRLIEKKEIKFIQFEFGHFHIYSRNFFLDFWELLSEEYELYRIKPRSVIRINEYSAELEVFRATNFICVLKSLNFKLN